MSIETGAASALIAAAILGHAWVHRISGPPQVVNAVGWVYAALVTLMIASQWVHCG